MAPTKLYVRNLSWNTTDDTLYQAFNAYGEVLDAIVMRDPDTARSRGFGFVTMATREQGQTAIDGLNGQDLDGRRITVSFVDRGKLSPASGERVQSSAVDAGNDGRIRVKGLGPYADEARLMEVFERFGYVVDATVEMDKKTGHSRGSGVVTMKSAADARAAVDTLDGTALGGDKLRMSIASDDLSFGRKALWFLHGFFCFA